MWAASFIGPLCLINRQLRFAHRCESGRVINLLKTIKVFIVIFLSHIIQYCTCVIQTYGGCRFSLRLFVSGSPKLKTTEPNMFTKLFTKYLFKIYICFVFKKLKNEPNVLFLDQITKKTIFNSK